MKINRKEFLEVIESVIPAISKTSYSVKQGDCLVFNNNKVITYNDSISVFYPIDFDITGAVPALSFHKILKSLKCNEIDLSINDDGILITSYDKDKVTGKTTVKLNTEVLLPIDNIPETDDWKELPSNFIDGLKLCATTTFKSKTDPIYNYIVIEDNTMLSTDAHRMMQYHLTSNLDRFYLPADIVSKLSSYEPKWVSVQYDWILFKNEKNVIFATRTIDVDEEFPIVNKESDKVNEEQFSVEELCNFQGCTLKMPANIIDGLTICKAVVGSAEEKVKVFGGKYVNCHYKSKLSVHKETNDVNTSRGKVKASELKVGDDLGKDFIIDNITYTHALYISSTGDIGKHQQKYEIENVENFDFTISPSVLISAMKLNACFTVNPNNGLKIENKDFTHFVCILDE